MRSLTLTVKSVCLIYTAICLQPSLNAGFADSAGKNSLTFTSLHILFTLMTGLGNRLLGNGPEEGNIPNEDGIPLLSAADEPPSASPEVEDQVQIPIDFPGAALISSPVFNEIDLLSTGNNCALFGIYYEQDNLERIREQVVGELLQHAPHQPENDTDISRHIRELMAVEILDYLDQVDPEIRRSRIARLAQCIRENQRTQLMGLLNERMNNRNNSEEDRRNLLDLLVRPCCFAAYVKFVLGVRIDDGAIDQPYPMLEITQGNVTVEDGATGALAAIAAMRGVTLRVYQRDAGNAENPYQLYATYNHGPAGVGIPEIHLLQTTADAVNAPEALNHFNLLIPAGLEEGDDDVDRQLAMALAAAENEKYKQERLRKKREAARSGRPILPAKLPINLIERLTEEGRCELQTYVSTNIDTKLNGKFYTPFINQTIKFLKKITLR